MKHYKHKLRPGLCIDKLVNFDFKSNLIQKRQESRAKPQKSLPPLRTHQAAMLLKTSLSALDFKQLSERKTLSESALQIFSL